MAKIAVIGTGLIGTSSRSRPSGVRTCATWNWSARTTRAGARSGAHRSGAAFNKIEGRLQPAIEDADVVVLATPVMAMKDLMEYHRALHAGRRGAHRRGKLQNRG